MFEAFEASPRSERVLAAENALSWNFPGCSISVPFSTFSESGFQENLAGFLEQASSESVKRFAARAQKAGYSTFESRDTGDPALITQMLMTLLEVNGRRTYPTLLRKRVRDDVCWTDGSEKPWRRCPLWLVLRVSLERYLSSMLGEEHGRCLYKFLLCLVHARLLEDSLHQLSPELSFFLKAKLSRRLVKLQKDMGTAPSMVQASYRYMFDMLEPVFLKATRETSRHVEKLWANFKASIQRPISALPQSTPHEDLVLKLPNSRRYLDSILWQPLSQSKSSWSYMPRQLPRKSDFHVNAHHMEAFNQCYSSLARMETAAEREVMDTTLSTVSNEEGCTRYAEKISSYLSAVSKSYDDNSEQKSLMLLTIMELWMIMDNYACDEFGLLEKFNPGFPTETLDVLQLFHLRDMERLQKIQNYLHFRYTKCGGCRMTIFDDPTQGCFAERMYNSSPAMQELHQEIEAAAKSARTKKEEEWKEMSAEFEDLTHTASEMSHIYTTEFNSFFQNHARDCPKCRMERMAGRMKIQVHEHPLPTSSVLAKAVIFELKCPGAFAAYRDATWKIISALGHAKLTPGFEPKVLISEYSELRRFRNLSRFTLSLASTTKSFLITHYSHLKFPVGLDDVCRPNGLKVGYYDAFSQVWPGRMQQKWPSFTHHCRIDNTCSTFSSTLSSPVFSPEHNGPSSYEVLASQTRCPSGMNVHEFMAFQALFSGKHRRWLVILNELGSSNLNFSTEATYTLISYLALHVGPQAGDDPLRVIHTIFNDNAFCLRLVEQLERRLDDLTNNWRENYCMGLLLSMTLRLCTFVKDASILSVCRGLLKKARGITHRWVGLLRAEIQKAVDSKTSQNCANYALWAALLCRHTFSLYSIGKDDMKAEALQCFIECSIALQDNVGRDPSTFALSLRNAFIRDAKMIHQLRFILRQSLDAYPESLRIATKTVWPEPENCPRSFSRSSFCPSPDEWWFQTVVDATEQSAQQTLHYHALNGSLLIDGQPLGKLPAEYRRSVVLKELFGDQSLLTVPSPLHGMTHLVCMPMYGHQIHLGLRDGKTIVRACVRDSILEFIPREIFYSPSSFDLPAPLVRCVHWLDLKTKIMEIRKPPNIWHFKESNWRIDLRTRRGTRRTVSLVDPQSRTFHHVASIFNQFEFPRELTVFQPSRRPLSVELRRLELSFFVNRNRCLESTQLRAFIDSNQDVGSWYGLNSKLCLRDTRTEKRSIVVPFGDMRVKRNQFHVTLQVLNSGSYAWFHINEVLGRIESPMEPRMLYLKAQLHAFTSFVIPDPLTGRTGTEESLHCLRSGYCQPWSPLKPINYHSLPLIANLTPKRHYYPQDLKVQQKVIWDDNLTTTIQHDAFRGLVEDITRKSEQLSTFATIKHELQPLAPPGDRHLSWRSMVRNCHFERPCSTLDTFAVGDDLLYEARDRFKANQGYQNVYESVTLIRKWAPEIPTSTDLAGILQNFPVIGGHNCSFDKVLLTDRLTIAFGSEWGSLVELCKGCDRDDNFRAQFLFAIMAFGADIDMDLVRTLIAFAILEELKAIEPPMWPCYSQFRRDQVPHVKYLVQLMKGCCLPFTDNVLSDLKYNLSSKQRKKLESAEIAHEQQSERDCATLAQILFNQWPNLEISLEGFPRGLLIDIPKAMEIIRPEWERLFYNLQLTCYLQLVQDNLNRSRSDVKFQPPPVAIPNDEPLYTCVTVDSRVSLHNLLCNIGPTLASSSALSVHADAAIAPSMPSRHESPIASRATPATSHEIQELESIINSVQKTDSGKYKSTVRERYATDLMQSLDALKKVQATEQSQLTPTPAINTINGIKNIRETMEEHLRRISIALERDVVGVQWYKEGGLWPCTTPVTLLEHLRSTCTTTFGNQMKKSLVTFGVSITRLQRLMRMNEARVKQNFQGLAEEEKNSGYSNWDPMKYPEWLLLQIDADFLIRPSQVEVALATIAPNSGSNSVLQMNMGQGKCNPSFVVNIMEFSVLDVRFQLRLTASGHPVTDLVAQTINLLLCIRYLLQRA